ncbi:hypothetical protein PSEUDO8O_80084 [Pseudomonas sp. 8O]|nr:hypothetical protein PSEUDO8O_80084 [Pseudomonas sp. 8O]
MPAGLGWAGALCAGLPYRSVRGAHRSFPRIVFVGLHCPPF